MLVQYDAADLIFSGFWMSASAVLLVLSNLVDRPPQGVEQVRATGHIMKTRISETCVLFLSASGGLSRAEVDRALATDVVVVHDVS